LPDLPGSDRPDTPILDRRFLHGRSNIGRIQVVIISAFGHGPVDTGVATGAA
jgi:hypothetical protein